MEKVAALTSSTSTGAVNIVFIAGETLLNHLELKDEKTVLSKKKTEAKIGIWKECYGN